MREILFRGKGRDNWGWYYGNYLFLHLPSYDWTGKASEKSEDVHYIEPKDGINIAIYPETVGQYTGLKDKNGKKIFEGDIVVFTENTGKSIDCYTINGIFEFKGVVEYESGAFHIKKDEEHREAFIRLIDAYKRIGCYGATIEIVSNIYDNP